MSNAFDSRFQAAREGKKYLFSTSRFTGRIEERNPAGYGRTAFVVYATELISGEEVEPFVKQSLQEVKTAFPNQGFALVKDDRANGVTSQNNQKSDDDLIREAVQKGEQLPKTWRARAIRLGLINPDSSSKNIVAQPAVPALAAEDAVAIGVAFMEKYPTFFSDTAPQMTDWNVSQIVRYMQYYQLPLTTENYEKSFRWLLEHQHLHDVSTFGKRRLRESIREYHCPTSGTFKSPGFEAAESRQARISRLSSTPSRELTAADAEFLKSVTTAELAVVAKAARAPAQ